MPITVWNPPAQNVRPPSSKAEELKRKDSESGGDGDSLLLNSEIAASAVSSVLPVNEVLALSLQGVTSVSSLILSCLISI